MSGRNSKGSGGSVAGDAFVFFIQAHLQGASLGVKTEQGITMTDHGSGNGTG